MTYPVPPGWQLLPIEPTEEMNCRGAAAFMRPMDGYAIITAHEATVVAYTAQSQSLKAMGRKDFQASKQAVLEVVAAMVGVAPDALHRNAREAA